MVALVDVRRWNPGALDGVYQQLHRTDQELMHAGDDFFNADTRLHSWEGIAAARALAEHKRLQERLSHHVAGLRLVIKAVAEAMDAVPAVQRSIAEAEELARKYGFRVGDNGEITDTITQPGPRDPNPEDRANAREEVRATLEQAVRTATDIDQDLARVLTRAGGGEVGTGNESTMAAAAAHGAQAQALTLPEPPKNATAAQNAAWWDTLSPNAQKLMLGNQPGVLGNRDGIPFTVRDKANRALIPIERARLEKKLADWVRAHPNPNDPRSGNPSDYVGKEETERLTAKLNALNELESMLHDPNGNPLPDRQLASLDMSGERAKAAVSVGNIDNTDHVSVFTPGMNSTVDGNMSGYVEDMENIRDRAGDQLDKHGTPGTVASVTYLGYEPPKVEDPGTWDEGFVSAEPAHDGGDKLASFYEGINATRPDDPHLTAMGHSYGSTTTGLALQHEGTGVDDAVFFGSPGIEDPARLNVGPPEIPERHGYVLEADGDPVADVGNVTGRFGSDPGSNPNLQQLSTQGAVDADGQQLAASHGHSEYTMTKQDGARTIDSTSLYNISNIVAGMPQYTITAPG